MRPLTQPESRLQAVSNKAGGTGSSRNRELGRVGSQAELNRKHMGGKNWAQLGALWGIDSISDTGMGEPRKDCKVLVILGGQNKEESPKLAKPNSQWDR